MMLYCYTIALALARLPDGRGEEQHLLPALHAGGAAELRVDRPRGGRRQRRGPPVGGADGRGAHLLRGLHQRDRGALRL